MTTANTIAKIESSSVAGKRSANSSTTDRFVMIEVPKSPRSSRPM